MRSLGPIFLLAFGQVNAQWYQMPDFPGTPRDGAAAFTIGDDVFVGTGMEVGSGLTNDWYSSEGSTAQWSGIAPLPATPRHYCSAFVMHDQEGGYGYLFGGKDTSGPLNELWRYDPATDNWTQMTSLPGEPRYAALAFNGGFVATGLLADSTATNELWKYDALTDIWLQLAPMPGTARHQACGMELGFMVVGGADEDLNALADCWSYNSLTDTWSACASLPEGRYGAMCSLAAYDQMIIGGATDTSTIVGTALSFNVTSWLPLGDPHPGGTRKGGIMILGGSDIPGVWNTYLGLGLSADQQRHNDWYIISGAFSISEPQRNRLRLHPNPVTEHVWPDLPEHWPYAECIVRDALGRIVVDHRLRHGSSLDMSELPSGRYDLLVLHNDEHLRAPLIKLP